jgi:hypothetical protein
MINTLKMFSFPGKITKWQSKDMNGKSIRWNIIGEGPEAVELFYLFGHQISVNGVISADKLINKSDMYRELACIAIQEFIAAVKEEEDESRNLTKGNDILTEGNKSVLPLARYDPSTCKVIMDLTRIKNRDEVMDRMNHKKGGIKDRIRRFMSSSPPCEHNFK